MAITLPFEKVAASKFDPLEVVWHVTRWAFGMPWMPDLLKAVF